MVPHFFSALYWYPKTYLKIRALKKAAIGNTRTIHIHIYLKRQGYIDRRNWADRLEETTSKTKNVYYIALLGNCSTVVGYWGKLMTLKNTSCKNQIVDGESR